MRFGILIISFLLFSTVLSAHEPNEAYFRISNTDNHLIINAELPWTIENAVVDFYPALESSSEKEDFDRILFDYIQTNLVIRNENDNILTLKTIEDSPSNGHEHQRNYIFTYNPGKVKSIENSILFNIYSHQVNYHLLYSNPNDSALTTTISEPKIFLSKIGVVPFYNNVFNWLLLGLVILLFLLSFYLFKRNR